MIGVEVLDVGIIKFEPLSVPEFKQREVRWKDSRRIYEGQEYAALSETFADEDCARLLYAFKNSRGSKYLSIRDKMRWLRFFSSDLTVGLCENLAKIVRADYFQRDHLELFWGNTNSWKGWAAMGFGVLDGNPNGELIGYKMWIPPPARYVFNLPPSETTTSAIWVPHG